MITIGALFLLLKKGKYSGSFLGHRKYLCNFITLITRVEITTKVSNSELQAPLTFEVPDIFQTWNRNLIMKYGPSNQFLQVRTLMPPTCCKNTIIASKSSFQRTLKPIISLAKLLYFFTPLCTSSYSSKSSKKLNPSPF